MTSYSRVIIAGKKISGDGFEEDEDIPLYNLNELAPKDDRLQFIYDPVFEVNIIERI